MAVRNHVFHEIMISGLFPSKLVPSTARSHVPAGGDGWRGQCLGQGVLSVSPPLPPALHMCFLSRPVAQRAVCLHARDCHHGQLQGQDSSEAESKPPEVWAWGGRLHRLVLDEGNGLCP